MNKIRIKYESSSNQKCLRNRQMENRKKKYEKIQVYITIVLFAAGGGLLWSARTVNGFAEWYSRSVYPVLVSVIGRFWGVFPFSAVEVLLYGGVLLLLFWLVKYFRRPLVLVRNYMTTMAALLFLYASCCGVNYYRIPFSSYYIAELNARGAAGTKNAVDEKKEADQNDLLKELCQWLTEEVNRARLELDKAEGNYKNIREKGVNAMNRLAEQYPTLGGYYPKPKPVLVSWILSVQQCSGVYSPFTIEANYNRDMVSYNVPHTICHELSHLRGFMREDEANFIGYLACIGSEDADYRYSGCLLGWIYAGNALAKIDYQEYIRIYGMLADPVLADLETNSEFWEQYEGEVAEVQEKVNDAYLKINGQEDGVKTYGRVVDLMLMDYKLNRRNR